MAFCTNFYFIACILSNSKKHWKKANRANNCLYLRRGEDWKWSVGTNLYSACFFYPLSPTEISQANRKILLEWGKHAFSCWSVSPIDLTGLNINFPQDKHIPRIRKRGEERRLLTRPSFNKLHKTTSNSSLFLERNVPVYWELWRESGKGATVECWAARECLCLIGFDYKGVGEGCRTLKRSQLKAFICHSLASLHQNQIGCDCLFHYATNISHLFDSDMGDATSAINRLPLSEHPTPTPILSRRITIQRLVLIFLI